MNIYTWNMQSMSSNLTQLTSFAGTEKDASIICLQEVGVGFLSKTQEPGNFYDGGTQQGVEYSLGGITLGSSRNPKNRYMCLCARFRGGTNSVAVLIRDELFKQGQGRNPEFFIVPGIISAGGSDTRPIPFLRLGNTFFGSIHAPSAAGSPAQMQWIRDMLQAANMQVAQSEAKFLFCAGDYNAEPFSTQAVVLPMRVTAPVGATQQSGNTLDYAVHNLGDNITNARTVGNFGSDHQAVGFIINPLVLY